MLDHETRTKLLQTYPFLGELSGAEMDELCNSAKFMRLHAGTIVFDENQPCPGFPLILSGNLRVIKAAPSGRELQLYRVMPGESCILTSSCLLGRTPYQARGLCEQEMQLVLVPAPLFQSLFERYPHFRDYVFHLFTERLTDLMQLVTAVAFQKLDQRLAALLVARTSPIHATHQALADELGSAREMVSRLLKGFSDQGWVRLGREQIEVLNPAALAQLAAS